MQTAGWVTALRRRLPGRRGGTPASSPLPPPPPLVDPPDAVYVFFVDVLPRGHAGRTASILTKTRLLWELAGIRSVIVTAYDSSQLDDIGHGLREQGLLAEGVQVASLHDFHPDETELSPEQTHRPFEEPGMTWLQDPDTGLYQFFSHGVHVLTKRVDYAGRTIVLDHYDASHARHRSDEFWPNGTTRRTVFFDRFYQVARQEMLHRRDGSVRLNIWWAVDPLTQVRSPQRVTVFDRAGRPERTLEGYPEVIHAGLDALIGDRLGFLSCEARRVDEWVLGYERPNVRKIFVLHNAHIRPPFDDLHRIRPIYAPVLTSPGVDATVFLTERQKDEAEQHFGPHPSYAVIPHSVPTPPPAPAIERDPKLVVMMARLDQQKQPDHAIDAFAQVVREVPDARLEIYGRGVLAPELRKQIHRLRLEGNVTLAGFTTDPGLAYRRAALSLLTSKYEGFGLTLVESFQQGCPAISYNLRYGPSDIIVDGVTGFLVPAEDKVALAERIVHALRHPDLLTQMSQAATARAAAFSEDVFVARWCALFDELGRGVSHTAQVSASPGV